MEPTLLDLPQDILEIIFLSLPPKSFLQFCSVSKQFWEDQRRNPTYWRVASSSTFRIPISPLLHAQGERWYWLFKKLRTQTRAFAWGQGRNGVLGLPFVSPNESVIELPHPNPLLPPLRIPSPLLPGTPAGNRLVPDLRNRAWPTKMEVPAEVGIIADLQCGGWSTTLLSSRGDLFSVGILNQDEGRSVGRAYRKLTRLDYQSDVPIKRFSAGRKHVLGLDEEGYVWSWDRIDMAGMKIHDVSPLKASIVVGGWSVSSAYTKDGIVYWRVPERSAEGPAEDATETPDDTHIPAQGRPQEDHFVKTITVPGTQYLPREPHADSNSGIGAVLGYIVLEAYIVFITDSDRVFGNRIASEEETKEPSFELPGYSKSGRHLKDIQGSFRKFSVFTDTGEVLSGDQGYLDQLHGLRLPNDASNDQNIIAPAEASHDIRRPADIPALQHTGVISMAYGDYHYHALHLDGRITSYGFEPESCGALGLGETQAGARFRGVKSGGGGIWNRDARLLRIGYRNGREIWFSASQKAWLGRLEALVRSSLSFVDAHTPSSSVLEQEEDKQAAYSEWIEREGRAWEEGVENEDGLRSHFALSVAAAGWHSAALVLENADLVKKIDEKWSNEEERYVWEEDGLPRISLPDGYEFPGSAELREWRGGMPTREEVINSPPDPNTS